MLPGKPIEFGPSLGIGMGGMMSGGCFTANARRAVLAGGVGAGCSFELARPHAPRIRNVNGAEAKELVVHGDLLRFLGPKTIRELKAFVHGQEVFLCIICLSYAHPRN